MNPTTNDTLAANSRIVRKPEKRGGAEESASNAASVSGTSVVALRQRGEGQLTTSDNRKLSIRIIESKCMGAGSCVIVAPSVFALDVEQLGLFMRGKQPLGVRSVTDGTVTSETVVIAAKSCPYKAIYVADAETGEELAGDPW